jgi:hypothetical protein
MAADSLIDQATPAQQGASSSAVEAAKAAAQLAWQQAAQAAQSAAEQRAGHSCAERQQGPPLVSGVTHPGDAIHAAVDWPSARLLVSRRTNLQNCRNCAGSV